jgi:hypothetical protein
MELKTGTGDLTTDSTALAFDSSSEFREDTSGSMLLDGSPETRDETGAMLVVHDDGASRDVDSNGYA